MSYYSSVDYSARDRAASNQRKYEKLKEVLDGKIRELEGLLDDFKVDVSSKHEQAGTESLSAEGRIMTTFMDKEEEWKEKTDQVRSRFTVGVSGMRNKRNEVASQINYWQEQVREEEAKIQNILQMIYQQSITTP
jgi:hypothetical protein